MYGNARDLERMVKKHPGEDFWVHEHDDGLAPLMFGLGAEPLEPATTTTTHPSRTRGTNSGDKLAMALELQPVSGRTLVLRGRRRPWWQQLWLRLLPGQRCRSCGARVSRTDPDGHPSRVWWCPKHGPLEQPELPGWK